MAGPNMSDRRPGGFIKAGIDGMTLGTSHHVNITTNITITQNMILSPANCSQY